MCIFLPFLCQGPGRVQPGALVPGVLLSLTPIYCWNDGINLYADSMLFTQTVSSNMPNVYYEYIMHIILKLNINSGNTY